MADLADLVARASTQGVDTAAKELDAFATSAAKASGAADTFGKGTDRLAKDAQRAAQAMKAHEAVLQGHAKTARLASHEMVNLGRQFGDIATMAAMGASPIQILTSQGAQVAEVFAVARGNGVTFSAALKQLAGTVSGLVTRFLPITAAIGAVVGGFALFERAVDANTKHATTWGDTWKATVKVVGDAIMDGPIGDGLKWLGRFFGATLDAITDGVMWFADTIVGHFGAAYELVIKNWRRLPEVFGVIVQGAANIAIRAAEGLVNKVIDGVNVVLRAAGKGAIQHINLPEIHLANAQLTAEYEGMAKSISASFKAGRESLLDKIAAQADKEFEARQKLTKATGEHAAARRDEAAAVDEQTKAIQAYLAAQDEELKRLQYSPEQIQMMEAEAKASDALAKGMLVEAAAILRKAEAIRQLREMQDKKPANDNFDFVVTPADIAKLGRGLEGAETGAISLTQRLEDAFGAAENIAYSVDQIAYAFRNNDWGAAVQGLLRAIDSIKKAYQQAMAASGGSRVSGVIGAAGATASAAGSLIGGRAGSVLGGAGSGAMIGLQVGGPVGAAVGAVLGGIAGALGYGSQKAEEKRQRDAQQMEAARQRAEQVTQARRELELQLIEASGDATAALAARRKAELEAMDASLRALQEQVWARQDAAQREAAIRAYEIQLMEAQGDAAGALALQREQELKAMDASLRGIQQLVWNVLDVKAAADKANADAQAGVDQARDRLTEAYRREADALTKTAERFRSLAQTLADFRKDLFAGDTASLNPLQQYRASRAEFDRVSTLARSGDETALGNLPSVAQAFLSASRAVATNGGAYNRDLALVRQAVTEAEKVATAQADTAELQLAELQRQASGLIDINGSVLSVRDAVAGLNAALANQAAVQAQQNALMAQALGAAQQAMAEAKAAQEAAAAAKPTSPSYTAAGWAGYVQGNQDLAAAYAAGTGMARGHTIEQFAQLHWERYGQYENRSVRPYARGGMHSGGLRLVGEEGPELEVTGPSRIFSADQTRDLLAGDNSELIAEVRALRSEVASLKSSAEKTAKSVDDMNKTGVYARGQTPGDPVVTEAA